MTTNEADLAESRDVPYHGKNHGKDGRDKVIHPLLGGLHTDSTGNPPTTPLVTGDIIVAQGSPPTFQVLATGVAGTVFIGGSTFSANLALTGWIRVGSATAPANTTAGDLTAVRINIGNASFTSGVEMQVTGDVVFSGYQRVGSVSAPTNTTPGDLTVVRLSVGDVSFATGAEAQVNGDAVVTGWMNVGVAAAPSNTTAGDLTAKRGHFGTDGAFTSGQELEVVGDTTISQQLTVGGDAVLGGALDHNGTTVGLYNHAVAGQGTGGQNVTNNVTNSGSTDGTIPDITDGVTYATDYVNLRRALYQLARMLKQDHDQLRAMGILT